MKEGGVFRIYYFFAGIFAISGLFFIILPFLDEGAYLMIIPGLMSLVSVGLILIRKNNISTKIFSLSSGIYNIVLFAYHAYSAIFLLGTSFSSFAALALIGYSLGSLVFLLVVLALYSDYSRYRSI